MITTIPRIEHMIDFGLLSDKPIIIDAGACTGEFIDNIFKNPKGKDSIIIAIEPCQTNFNYLVDKYVKIANVEELYEAALYNIITELEFIEITGKFREWGSLYPSNIAKAKIRTDYTNSKSYKVKTVTLEQIIKECHIDCIDYLKMDIEGAESVVLPNLHPNIFSMIQQISVECHTDSNGMETTQKISILLQNYNFKTIVLAKEVYGYK